VTPASWTSPEESQRRQRSEAPPPQDDVNTSTCRYFEYNEPHAPHTHEQQVEQCQHLRSSSSEEEEASLTR